MDKIKRQFFADIGRKQLIRFAIHSEYIKERTTFKEHIALCKEIRSLPEDEVFEIMQEGIREFEGAFRKFLKYSFSIIAAGAAGPAAPLLGPLVLYSWRKLNDPCYRQCFNRFGRGKERNVCKYECQYKATQGIVRRLRSEFGKCNQFEDKREDKCKKKLRKHLVKWEKKLQQQKSRLEKAKAAIEDVARQAKAKELSKKASKELRKPTSAVPYESLSLDHLLLMHLISESSVIRKNLSFPEHLALFSAIKRIPEESATKISQKIFEQDVDQPKVNPEMEKKVRIVLYLGLWLLPIPFFNDVVNYIIKKHDFACMKSCIRDKDRDFCYRKCRYEGRQYAVKFLQSQVTKCNKSKKPLKCKKKVLNMLEDWRQRAVESKHKYEEILDKRLSKLRRMKAGR
jgi:hypothetical protein